MRDRVLGSYGILSGRLPAWRPGWLRLTQLHFRYNLMHCHLIVLEFVAPTGHNKKNTHKKNQVFRIFFFFSGCFFDLVWAYNSSHWCLDVGFFSWQSGLWNRVCEITDINAPFCWRPSTFVLQLAFGFHLPLCILLNPGWLLLCLHLLSHVWAALASVFWLTWALHNLPSVKRVPYDNQFPWSRTVGTISLEDVVVSGFLEFLWNGLPVLGAAFQPD